MVCLGEISIFIGHWKSNNVNYISLCCISLVIPVHASPTYVFRRLCGMAWLIESNKHATWGYWCVRYIQGDLSGTTETEIPDSYGCMLVYIYTYIYMEGIVYSTARCLCGGCVLRHTCIIDTPSFLISQAKGWYRISTTRYWQVGLTCKIVICITWMWLRDMVAYLNATALYISTMLYRNGAWHGLFWAMTTRTTVWSINRI